MSPSVLVSLLSVWLLSLPSELELELELEPESVDSEEEEEEEEDDEESSGVGVGAAEITVPQRSQTTLPSSFVTSLWPSALT